jgi:glycosyltransferase involved in cell wall biosynthesis
MTNFDFKVSVIIPLFNAEKYIRDAVESALSLTEVGEIIIVDDGSTDNSYDIAINLSTIYSSVKVYSHSGNKNLGPAATRNLGIRSANCMYISFLDADDIYQKNRFKCSKEIFLTQPQAEVVYACSHTIFLNEEGKKRYYNYEESHIYTLFKKIDAKDLFKALLFYGYGRIHTSAITIKVSALIKTGLFNETLLWGEDTELWLRLAYKTNMVPGDLENPVSLRRIHNNNLVHQVDKAKHYEKEIYHSLFDWASKNKLDFETKNNIYNALGLITDAGGSKQTIRLIKFCHRHLYLIFDIFFYKKIILLLNFK